MWPKPTKLGLVYELQLRLKDFVCHKAQAWLYPPRKNSAQQLLDWSKYRMGSSSIMSTSKVPIYPIGSAKLAFLSPVKTFYNLQ